jgi:hypothetical protein
MPPVQVNIFDRIFAVSFRCLPDAVAAVALECRAG